MILEIMDEIVSHRVVRVGWFISDFCWTAKRNKVYVTILEWLILEVIGRFDSAVARIRGYVLFGLRAQFVKPRVTEYDHCMEG